MDQNNNQPPKHVQIENSKKPEKNYVIAHNLNAKEGEVFYITVKGIMQAFTSSLQLKQQGATVVKFFQEVELKVTVH